MLCLPALLSASTGNAGSALGPALMHEIHHSATQSVPSTRHRIEIEVGHLDPRLTLAPCEKVEPHLPPNAPLWGKSRIGLRCASGPSRWNVYLPLTVKAFAHAWVAATALPAGTVVSAGELREAEVDWAAEPDAPIVQSDRLLGRVLARPIAAGQALRASALRPRQWFAGGDIVRVTVRGVGFAAVASGQALTAGIEGQSARVRTEGGRVVTAWRWPSGDWRYRRDASDPADGRRDSPSSRSRRSRYSVQQSLSTETLMKIGNPDGKSPLERLTGGERAAPAGPGKAERHGAEVDASAKVELSGAASQLLCDAGASVEFDAAKVARIAQAIAEGKYQINADVIADKLIANAEALLGKAAR